MPLKQLTMQPTEAEFEAELHGALMEAFPWLPEGSIQHQTKFSFTFGHKQIDVDGMTVSRAEARSDILLIHDGKPLAVL
jgi:type I site-specific restriction endonuclease